MTQRPDYVNCRAGQDCHLLPIRGGDKIRPNMSVVNTKPLLVRGKKPTIYDVAEQAQVSSVTVSRVLNDYPHVSKRMRTRVLEAARKLGFAPKLVARPNRLAVVIGHLDRLHGGNYKAHLLMRMIGCAAERGYGLDFVPAERVDLVVQRAVEGVMEFGLTSRELDALDLLPNIPTLLINKEVSARPRWSTVVSDHKAEAEMAVEHLIAHGHTRIALVLDEAEGWSADHRTKGYLSALAKVRGSGVEPLVFSVQDTSIDEVVRQVKAQACTALVNFTDNEGLRVLGCLQYKAGLRIPQDVSVVGLDHEGISENLLPPMTTVRQPLDQIAEHAVAGLIEMIEHHRPAFHIRLNSDLVVRNSVSEARAHPTRKAKGSLARA